MNAPTQNTANENAGPPLARTRISRRQVAGSVLSSWSGLAVNVGVAFWMTPFVVRHLGNDAYGIWALVLQLTGYLGIVDVGLRSAIVRFVSKYHAQGDQAGLNRLLNSIIACYVSVAPICLAVGAVLALVALPRLHIPPGMLVQGQITAMIAAAILACDFIFAVFHAGLAGLSRWDLTNGVSIAALLVRTLLTVVLLEKGFGLVALAVVQLSMTVLAYLTEWLLLQRLIPEFHLQWRKPERGYLRPILEHSWYSLLLSFANRLNYQVDAIVIAAFLPIEQVTLYVIGCRLVEYLRDLLNATTMVIAPLASALDAVDETERVGRMFIRATKYSLLVGFLGAALLLGLGRAFIGVWMGPKFMESSGTVMITLALGQLVSCTQFAAGHVLFGLGKHRMNLKWTFAEGVLNLGLSLALVHRYGIFGVAAGTSIANLIIRGWFFPREFLKLLGVNPVEYLRRSVLPSIVPAAAVLTGVTLYKSAYGLGSYAHLFLALLWAGALSLPCLWFFGLDSSERALARMKGRQIMLGASEG